MTDLFAPNPTDNLLPHKGQLYNLGLLDLGELADNPSDLYEVLLNSLSWQSDVVRLFGKTHVTRRQIVWMGDEGLSYRYAGHTHIAMGWHPAVFHVKQLIEDRIYQLKFDTDAIVKDVPPYFNACLLNFYPSGSEGMGYHADDEKELGDQPLIAALSLGATRKMLFKHTSNNTNLTQNDVAASKKTLDKVELYLTSGQVIVMAGTTQQYWKHSITKTTTVSEGRISLTFRYMLTL